MNKLVVFGSARADAFLELPAEAAEKLCDIDTKKCVIELSYSSKIPLDGVHFLLGGNGANVAVGTKRLGVDSMLVAELGQGPLADFSKKELDREIDTTYVTQTEGVAQGFGAVIMYQGERTILSYYAPLDPQLPKEIDRCETEWAYLTSTGERFERYYEQIYEWLTKCESKLAFNPGGRQIAKGTDWLKKYLERCEIIFVNREEAEKIVGTSGTFGKEKDLLKSLSSLGPKICVVTDGADGSFVYDGKRYIKAGILPIDSYERTGAGDAFGVGCLSAIIKGKSFEEALLWGTINSASVIGYIGPENGLLAEKDIPEWIERAKSSEVKVEEF